MRIGVDASLLSVWSESDQYSVGLDGYVRWWQVTAGEAVSEQQRTGEGLLCDASPKLRGSKTCLSLRVRILQPLGWVVPARAPHGAGVKVSAGAHHWGVHIHEGWPHPAGRQLGA